MSNILVIKHGSLGDIAQACGAIQDISESHPRQTRRPLPDGIKPPYDHSTTSMAQVNSTFTRATSFSRQVNKSLAVRLMNAAGILLA